MKRLISVNSAGDILIKYRNTPVEKLFQYQNLSRKHDRYQKAELLLAMCMDHRKKVNLPDNFAYIIRTGGANLRNLEFYVSYGIAVAGVKHIAIVGHNHCGMENLSKNKALYADGMVNNAGWEREEAEEYFEQHAPDVQIGDETTFIVKEAERIRQLFPGVEVAPLMYMIEDHKLFFIEE